MQELTFDEIGQVSGGLGTMTDFMIDLQGALGQVGATFDALVSAVVDVACSISGSC